MNKLLVSDIIDLKENSYELETQNKELTLNIEGEVLVYFKCFNLNKLDINLKDNSILKMFIFNENMLGNLKVTINQKNNSKMYYNMSYLNNDEYKLELTNNIEGNNNTSMIDIRNIANANHSEMLVDIQVLKDTKDNIALENLKGINNGGVVHIEPNIICLSNEVTANHLTTIGGLDKNSLNYLMSKGINEKDAEKLLLKGFIYGNMDDYIRKNFGGE